MMKKLSLLMIVFSCLFCSFLLCNLPIDEPNQADDSHPFTQLVGSEEDISKDIVVLWHQPEEVWNENLFQKILNIKDILAEYGYKLVFKNELRISDNWSELRNKLLNPDEKTFVDIAKSFNSISDAEVLAVFGHGFSKGPAIAYFIPDSNPKKDPRVVLMQKIFDNDNNYNLYKYIFGGDLSPSSTSSNNQYTGALGLNNDGLNVSAKYKIQENCINNGITFLGVCQSNSFFTVFISKGAKTVYYVKGEEKTQRLGESFVGILKSMIGESTAFYLDSNEVHSKTDINKYVSIFPEIYDYNYTRSLLRSPHIEEVIIYNADNENDIYYHYVYVGKDKYNPTESYPGKEILKVKNGDLSLETMIKSGFLKKPIPIWNRFKIKLVFSKSKNNRSDDNEKASVKIKFWVSDQSGYKQYLLNVIKSNDQTNSTSPTWIGVIDILNNKELSKAIQSKNVGANLLVSYIDPQKSNKTWFLDVNGDGKWTDKTNEDGEIIDGKYYDNNHWFRVAVNKIYSLWITPGRSLQGDYNSAVVSNERTIENYGYYNYLNKEHIAGKNLKINLLMDVGGLEESGEENKSA